MWQCEYFDGKTSQSQTVKASSSNGQMQIVADGIEIDRWHAADMQVLRDEASSLRIENKATDARLQFVDSESLQELQKAFPEAFTHKLAGRDWRKLFLWGGGAIVSLVLIIFLLLPKLADYLAISIPREREVELGHKLIESLDGGLMEVMMGDMRQCTDEAGLAAINTMIVNLTAQRELDYDIEIYVVNSSESNAFALPGGQVVFLNGLIQSADTPNEVAGVLAHEIGHVEARDPLRIMLGSLGRSSILSIVLGDISGGILAVAAIDTFVNAAYSQDAEAQADEFAIEMLNESGIGTEGFASFFDAMSDMVGDEDSILSHFSSHPQLQERSKNALSKGIETKGAAIISDDEWAALKNVCDTLAPRQNPDEDNMIDSLIDRFDLESDQS